MTSSLFEQFIERRKLVRAALDYFSAAVLDVMVYLCESYPLIDPVSGEAIMRVESARLSDGSITAVLFTSNARSLTFYFQSNGEARIVSALDGSQMSEEYVDFSQGADGGAIIAIEETELTAREYIVTWVEGAFEE